MTTGLRSSELIGDERGGKPGLRKNDLNGRVLTIWSPKSGRESEIAVIPSWVEKKLREHLKKFKAGDRILSINSSTLYDIIKTHGRWLGLKLNPHYFRKWVASFWNRLDEHAMVNFVLRHSTTKIGDVALVTSLNARYVAPLSEKEAMAKQDQYMTEELFTGAVKR
jgi:hypothetical protein